MTETDVFTFKNSGLNAFLFSEVGIEQNGSPLTVLSTLARLGNDPWAQAAEWAKMPNAARIDGLTKSILRMPLHGQAYVEARATATRLVRLLPRQNGQVAGGRLAELNMPEWLPVAAFCVVIGLAIVVGTFAIAPVASTAPTASVPAARSFGSNTMTSAHRGSMPP
jgi:hypothetical protein